MEAPSAAEVESPAIAKWRQAYAAVPGSYDEMLDEKGEIRPHWRRYVEEMDSLGPQELARRWEFAKRLIHENGVSYNVYGDPRGMDRPWVLDAVPLVISAREWSDLDQALIQRARLFDLFLADIYGPQKLIREGVLPAELIFAHPGFLRPCHGVTFPGNCCLHLYSADIARSPDGHWSVIGDRTQAPSGAGYALENRIILSRIFQEIFKNCQVQRLALFFRRLRETLASAAPYNRDNPRIVLLTPGPSNETYFEHAYLARYLNYTLVEGGDLTVRDQCVYLKTLGGLHRVDVIMRRLDDDYCDPLELRPDSFLGVPGLMQAVRAGTVAVSNPLGSGLAESPALKPFLPALCKYLLNEQLLLPSVPTYWCGQRSSLQYVLENLEKLVIKPAIPKRELNSVFGEKLTLAQRTELRDRIRARPQWFVAQEQVAISTAPVLVGDRIEPRHTVLRTFVSRSENTYCAMAGGLTQVPISAETLVFSLQRGAGSKDTWVQSAGPVNPFSMLKPAGHPIELSRGGGDLPSRVADNLFWMGRYVERAESSVRLLRGIAIRLSEKSVLHEVRELPHLLRALRQQSGKAWTQPAHITDKALLGGEMHTLLEESRAPGGLYPTLRALQGVARIVRDRISTDTWRILNTLHEDTAWPKTLDASRSSDIIERLNTMVMSLASLGGLASESMTRGQVWLFMDMGRRLERAARMSRLLRSTLVQPVRDDGVLLEAVLEIADSFMTYRRRYLANLQLAPVLDLLLSDETNPHSVAFQLVALNGHVESLPREAAQARLSPEQRIALGGLSELRLVDVEELCQEQEGKGRHKLADLLTRIDDDMGALSDIVTRQYLSHAQTSRQLASFRPEV
jgi:uncharacterized circularly permuted ATP-grasp superfamily protein/uncharacterized alpha-E superfamily protein